MKRPQSCPAELPELERELEELLTAWTEPRREYIEQAIDLMQRVASAPVRSINDARIKLRIVLTRATVDPYDPTMPLESSFEEEQLAYANALRSVLAFLERRP